MKFSTETLQSMARTYPERFSVREYRDALRQAAEDAENLSAAQFIAYLIDNHEGETVSEYMLQIWLADAMTATRTPKEQTK